MRLKLNLLPENSPHLHVNYNYALSAAIYKLLRFGSEEFADILHNKGYKLNGKVYKLFSFALKFNKIISINKNRILLGKKNADLIISSPLIDEFMKNFIYGSFSNSKIELVTENIKTIFNIQAIETIECPSLREEQKFLLYSPLVLSTGYKDDSDKFKQKFIRYQDDLNMTSRILNTNLKNKYEIIHKKTYEGSDLFFEWDNNYAEKRIKDGKYLTRKVSVIKNEEKPIDIVGNMIPFTLKGNVELMKVGYDCGFGEKNSLGFGLAELI